MKLETRKISPQIAAAYLNNAVKNRKVNKRRIENMAAKMKNKSWNASGETIKFDSNGTLIDGQHRLKAIIMSNTTQEMAVAYDLDPIVFTELDTGKKRTLSDVLFIENFTSHTHLATATKGIYSFVNFGIDQMSHGRSFKSTSEAKTSNRTYLEFLKNHPEIVNSLMFVLKCGKQKLVTTSFLIVMHYIFKTRSRKDADIFIQKFITGDNLALNNPILRLREKMIQQNADKIKVVHHDQTKMFVIAWNKWRGDQSLKYFRIDTNKPMPRII